MKTGQGVMKMGQDARRVSFVFVKSQLTHYDNIRISMTYNIYVSECRIIS